MIIFLLNDLCQNFKSSDGSVPWLSTIAGAIYLAPHRFGRSLYPWRTNGKNVNIGARLIFRKIDFKMILGLLFVLSFVSLTSGLASTIYYEHGILLTFTDNLPKGVLGLMCIAFVLFPFTSWNRSELWVIGVSLLFLLEQLIAVHFNQFGDKAYAYPLLLSGGMFAGIIAERLTRSVVLRNSEVFLSRMVRFLLAYFVLEAAVRFVYSPIVQPLVSPDLGGGYNLLYKFKFSVFFMEANYVSMALLCLLAVMHSHRRIFTRSDFVLAYVLLMATFSRAVFFPAIAQVLITVWWEYRRRIAIWLSVGAIALNAAILTLYLSRPELFSDPSFAVKLYAFTLVLNFYSGAALWQKMLGIGMGNSSLAIGEPVHTIVSTFMFEFGIAGSILFLLYLYLMAKRSPKAIYYLIVPFAIYGISIVGVVTSSFLFTLGLLANSGSEPDIQTVALDRRNLVLQKS